MNYNHDDWVTVWRGLAVTFLTDGHCALRSIERWAKENKFHLRLVREVLESMVVEGFDHEGATYLRLSGQVIPLVPRDVRDVRVYRQAGSAA